MNNGQTITPAIRTEKASPSERLTDMYTVVYALGLFLLTGWQMKI